MGLFVKTHINSKTLRPDVKQCLRTLKQLAIRLEIKSIGIIRDLAVLTLTDWSFLIEQCNQTFKGIAITIVFFNLPGITKTYDRLTHEYYWRNMQSDVRQFVRACPDCQTDKLVRLKTRLPMIISDTPSKPFTKISINFVGPKEVTRLDNQYILTIQDNFSMYCILAPTKQAAEEVTRVLTEKIISYFGTPAVIISDQGTHFVNKI